MGAAGLMSPILPKGYRVRFVCGPRMGDKGKGLAVESGLKMALASRLLRGVNGVAIS